MQRSCVQFGVIVFVVFLLSSCGGAAFKLGEPFDEAESRFFDDGVDLISDLSMLSGGWAFNESEQLEARVQLSDLIAIVEIGSVQTTSDLDGSEAIRLDAKIIKALLGGAPSATLSLNSEADAPGYSTITRHERRLTGTFIAFLRFFKDSKGKVDHHFHLSLASPAIEDDVRRRIDSRIAEMELKSVAK